MITVAERNEKGKVKIDGELVATIPHDKSMLSFFSNNPVLHKGEDYTVDENWVFLNGKPIRKQLHNVCGEVWDYGQVRVWKPNIEDLQTLEARRWAQVKAVRDFHENRWRPAFQAIIDAGGKAHAKPTHTYTGDQNKWWLWDADERGISFNWVDAPETPIHQELGQHFYHLYKYSKSVYNRLNKFRVALERAFIDKLDKETGTHSGYFRHDEGKINRQIHFEVNSRHYWYQVNCTKNGVFRWTILSWPDFDCQTIKV